MNVCLSLFTVLATTCLCGAQEPRTQFLPGQTWPDNHGIPINAHGGGVLYNAGTYFWFGEHKTAGTNGNWAQVGVHCYSSKDLYNWKDEGVALAVSEDPASDIAKGCILERPKVIHNAKTGKFVMWFHLELKGQEYRAARCGVAVADQPAGPYTYLRSFRPNAGCWPVGVAEEQKDSTDTNNYLARDFAGGQMARDMTLFVDDNGKAYLIYASEENETLHISQLTDDYLSTAGIYRRIFVKRFNEAPAICKYHGHYWLLTSGCSGWAPNTARLSVADSILGPWKELGNPCVGTNSHNNIGAGLTFGGQSTYILPVAGKPGAFIAMFDIWKPDDAITGGYVWLPITFQADRFVIRWRDAWDLSIFKEDETLAPDLQPVTPCFRPKSDQYYQWAMDRHNELVKQSREQDIEVAFYGDSLIQFLDGDVWQREAGPLKAGNFGISSDRVENLLWRLQNGELDGLKHLKVAVVMIGSNNYGSQSSAASIATGIELVLKTIRQRQPQAKILLLGLSPEGWNKDDDSRRRIKAINVLLAGFKARKLCDDYLDWGGVLLNSDGSMNRALSKDGCHYSKAGSEAFFRAVKPAILKCLNDAKAQEM